MSRSQLHGTAVNMAGVPVMAMDRVAISGHFAYLATDAPDDWPLFGSALEHANVGEPFQFVYRGVTVDEAWETAEVDTCFELLKDGACIGHITKQVGGAGHTVFREAELKNSRKAQSWIKRIGQ